MSGPRIARIAVFAALVAVFGLTPAIPVPGFAVPITAQTLAVMLAGLMLAPIEAFLAVSLWVGLLAMGLPLLPGGVGGLSVFTTPRAGFVLGFPLAAAAVALIVGALRRLPALSTGRGHLVACGVASVIGGIAVLYAFAVPVGSVIGDIPLGKFARLMLTFVPGDLLKAGAAAVVATSAFRAAPMLKPRPA